MKAIFYNLCFGALDDAAQDGVNERWYIFQDNNHAQKDVHALSAPFKSDLPARSRQQRVAAVHR